MKKKLKKKEFWSYSNVSCVGYPLDGLDTVNFNNGKIERKAALSFIIDGESEEHLDMLEILVVKRLLEDKWSLYVQVISIKKNKII